MVNLDLTVNSGFRPSIDGIISMTGDGVYDKDGWVGDEYALFTKLDMWNQGNDAKELLATAFIAYDCENKILVSENDLMDRYKDILKYDIRSSYRSSYIACFTVCCSAPQQRFPQRLYSPERCIFLDSSWF
jgi:hypothetical protein